MTARDARPSPRELGARELAGYRVLRSLARDEGAEVLLGHRRAQEAAVDTVQTVAMKVSPASHSAWQVALHECAALERARGDHVVDLLDLDADDESIRLIFERLPRGDLAELLRIRPRWEAGEAVTVLAPIAATLLRMHASGVAHGRLGPATVLFRDDGSPTLIGFSQAELFEPGAPEVVLEQVEAVRRDRDSARALASAVLGRVDGARARAAREVMADLEGCDGELVLPVLASRLFEVAAAMPIRFDADEPEIAPSQWRAIPIGEAAEEPLAKPLGALPRWTAMGRLVPEPLVQRTLDLVAGGPAAPVIAAVTAAVRRRWGSWNPVRRRVALGVAAAAATVAIVTAVVPAGAVATRQPASARSESAAASGASRPSALPRTGDRLGASDPVLMADDPLSAADELVSARDRCLRSLSLRCLDGVEEQGSSALQGDQAAIRAAQQGAELPDPLPGGAGGGDAVLIQRLGDSALVRLGEAASGASLLLVKGDAGWRIRDLIPTSAVSPSSRPAPIATG